jgi:hypothetical protein
MRNRSSLAQGCVRIIALAHFLIFLSLFSPVQFPLSYSENPPCIGWQLFFPSCHLSPSDLHILYPHGIVVGFVRFALIALIVLALPPLASVAVFRPRSRMSGLIGLWISLPLTLGSCLFFVIEALPAFAALEAASPATWFPPLGFALSFIACLVLALHQPLIRVSRPVHVELGQHERTEWASPLPGVGLPAHSTRGGFRLLFSFIGLLCHLGIGLSLFFTYIDTYNPYGSATSPDETTTLTTGWQLLGEAFQAGIVPTTVAIVLLAALVLPVPIYLMYLLPFSWRSDWINRQRFSSASLSRLLNIIGLSLSGVLLLLFFIFRGGDMHQPMNTTHLAFVVPPTAFLLSLLCSTVLISSGLR